MSEIDREAAAREKGAEIENKLSAMRLKMVSLAHDFGKQGGTSLQDLSKLRESIEALEYALTCVPKDAARMYMKNV